MSAPRRRTRRNAAARIAGGSSASLLDLVDNLLSRGVLLDGEVVLGVADVDLIYLRLSALLTSVDVLTGRRRPR